MIRMTRLTDYGIMLLTSFARDPGRPMRNARDLAVEAHLPLSTVRKVLKILAHHRLLEAHRGVKGGFALARKPEEVRLDEIIEALEGPIAFTKCSSHKDDCRLERVCPVRSNWRRINRLMLGALRGVTLAEMAREISMAPVELRPAAAGGLNG